MVPVTLISIVTIRDGQACVGSWNVSTAQLATCITAEADDFAAAFAIAVINSDKAAPASIFTRAYPYGIRTDGSLKLPVGYARVS